MIAVDTNVLVYAVDLTETQKQPVAEAFLASLGAEPIPPILPWQVVVEYGACLRKWEHSGRMTRAETMLYLGRLERLFRVVFPRNLTLRDILELATRSSLSYWDSLLIAACIEAGVTTLYSEDMQSGANYGGVEIINPFAP